MTCQKHLLTHAQQPTTGRCDGCEEEKRPKDEPPHGWLLRTFEVAANESRAWSAATSVTAPGPSPQSGPMSGEPGENR